MRMLMILFDEEKKKVTGRLGGGYIYKILHPGCFSVYPYTKR